MKRLLAWFGIVLLLLPAISYVDDAIALQDGWFNADPSDDVISKAPHGLKSTNDDSSLAVSLRQLVHFQAVAPYVLRLQFSSRSATPNYAFNACQTCILPVRGRSPPLV